MADNQLMQQTLETFVGKWKPIIIYHLITGGTKRYSELQKLIPEINKRMLTLRLRELEANKIITRKVYQEVPVKVEYSITEYGYSLQPILISMNEWGNEHVSLEDMGFPREDNPENICSALTTINTIIGKWKPLVIFELLQHTRRFSELQKLMPSINKRMLTMHLRDLEAEGIIHREVYKQVPPKVEYSITEYGETLRPIIDDLMEWGRKHQ